MAAMYTKMTASGSALVVNPRSISRELEVRIAASIATVIAKHDAAKLTTKLVRQAVEKDVHVSLTNHKELLKRLMHQEFRKLKAAKVRALIAAIVGWSHTHTTWRAYRLAIPSFQVAKRVAPLAWKSVERRDAMRRGLYRVFVLMRDDSALFARFGLHAMQTLCDLQAVETGDIRRLATLYTRLLGALWLKSEQLAPTRFEWASPASPPSAELVRGALGSPPVLNGSQCRFFRSWTRSRRCLSRSVWGTRSVNASSSSSSLGDRRPCTLPWCVRKVREMKTIRSVGAEPAGASSLACVLWTTRTTLAGTRQWGRPTRTPRARRLSRWRMRLSGRTMRAL